MGRLFLVVLLVAGLAGGAYFYLGYRVEVQRGGGGLDSIAIVRRGGRPPDAKPSAGPPQRPTSSSIRIATFNLSRLDEKKLGSQRVSNVLVRVIPRFDLVAVQDVRARNRGVLLRLVEQINAAGREYDFAICPTVQRDAATQYSAFVFNRQSIEIDRSTVQSVEDPQGRFRHKPLVALFRAKGPDLPEAFTFRLINVHIDPDRTAIELDLLDDVYRAVRDGGPEEDDVILLGDLGAGDGQAGQLGEIAHITASIAEIPTTIRGTRPVDNILFDRRATSEFTGRSGVLDVMREFNLTWRDASEVSEHLPVWAEFSSHEGGQSGHVGERTRRTIR